MKLPTVGGLLVLIVYALKWCDCANGVAVITGLVANPLEVVAFGSPVTFVATVATGDDVSFVWYFPQDGTNDTGAEVTHVFVDQGPQGNYTALVMASNSVSNATTATTAAFVRMAANAKVLPPGSLTACPDSEYAARIITSVVNQLNITSGDVLVTSDCGGLIMALTGDAFYDNTYWKFYFTNGGVEDVFEDAHFELAVNMSGAVNSTTPAEAKAEPEVGSTLDEDFSLPIHWEPESPFVIYEDGVSSIETTPSFDFTPVIRFKVVTANHQLVEISYSTAGDIAVSLSTLAAVSAALSVSGSVPLVSIPFKSVIMFIGPVPFVFTPTLSFNVGFSVSVGDVAKLESVLSASSGIAINMGWSNSSGWTANSEAHFTFTDNTPTLSFGCAATISIWLQPALGITMDKVFPLTVDLTGTADMGFSVPAPWDKQDSCPCQDTQGHYGLLSTSLSLHSAVSLGLPKQLGSFSLDLFDRIYPGSETCLTSPVACPTQSCGKCPTHCSECDSSGQCSYCDLGWWGIYCDQPCCSSSYCRHCGTTNYACDQETGKCSYCELGWWGDNCDQACYPPRHCSATAHACDMQTGHCSGCDLGWWGIDCDTPCSPRHCGSTAQACDQYDGSCPWCEACWTGTDCMEYDC